MTDYNSPNRKNNSISPKPAQAGQIDIAKPVVIQELLVVVEVLAEYGRSVLVTQDTSVSQNPAGSVDDLSISIPITVIVSREEHTRLVAPTASLAESVGNTPSVEVSTHEKL